MNPVQNTKNIIEQCLRDHGNAVQALDALNRMVEETKKRLNESETIMRALDVALQQHPFR